MNSKRKLVSTLYILLMLSPILWGALARPHGRQATLKMKQATVTTPLNTDVVFYPFELAKGVNTGSYFINDQDFSPVNKHPYLARGIVELTELNPLFAHFSVSSLWELQEVLGQYSGYYNFDGIKVLSFLKYSTSPAAITIAIIKDEQVNILTDTLPLSIYSPDAVVRDHNRIIVSLKNSTSYLIKTIDLTDYSVNTSHFYLSDVSLDRFNFVDMTYEDNQIYLLANQYEAQQNPTQDIMETKYSGGYLATYSLDTAKLHLTKVSNHKLDFLARDYKYLIFGYLESENQLSVTKYSLDTNQQVTNVLKLPENCSMVDERSAFYKDGYLYIHLNGASQSNKMLGHFFMIDLSTFKISNRYTYEYKGGLSIRYYKPGSGSAFDEAYFTPNLPHLTIG